MHPLSPEGPPKVSFVFIIVIPASITKEESIIDSETVLTVNLDLLSLTTTSA